MIIDINHLFKNLKLLWNYLNIYYLKPFDAVNDTLTASLLQKCDWIDEYIELGSGDGVFSYIMHGGTFPITFDRYLDVDLSKNDIFDTHLMNINKLAKNIYPKPLLSVDAKENHIKKIKELNYSLNSIKAQCENLPLPTNYYDLVFQYTPHGISSYDKCVLEAMRIVRANGKLIILIFNNCIDEWFVMYNCGVKYKYTLGNYFMSLDNGRKQEISHMSKNINDWEKFVLSNNFVIEKKYCGLTKYAWIIYDIQTRPILNKLILIFNILPKYIRALFKILWMLIWYPIIIIVFYLLALPNISNFKYCYYVYQLKKIG